MEKSCQSLSSIIEFYGNENQTLKDSTLKAKIINLTSEKKAIKISKTNQYSSVESKSKPQRETNNDLKQSLQLELIEKLISFESEEKPGYFDFRSWCNINQNLFKNLLEQTSIQFWKILRIINYGEVLLPSGLVYEVLRYMMLKGNQYQSKRLKDKQKKYRKNQSSLKKVLNQFLTQNKVQDKINCFKALQNYKSLEKIQQQYIHSILSIKQKSFKQNIKKQNPEKVFDRIYQDYFSRAQKSQKFEMKNIINQVDHTFHPRISSCKSHTNKKCERICHHTQLFKKQNIEKIKEDLFCDHQFKAKPIDPHVYGQQVNDIQGVQEHVQRRAFCEAQKLRLKRKVQRPIGTKI